MISGIGQGNTLARNAIEAALARQAEALREMQQKASSLDAGQAETAKPGGFGSVLAEGLGSVDSQAKQVDRMHVDVLQGKLDVHEAAARIQQSKLAFDFAMQVRDRFIDAYREVMRMSV